MPKRVVVAMSGGVDSSVVAGMLCKDGYEVVGITMQLYDYGKNVEKQKSCCASRDIFDAKETADILGIKHYTLNYESVFKQEVIEGFVDSYLKGFTPIPCVTCNQTVKFRDLYKFAKQLGAEFLATGHYVNKLDTANGPELHTGFDKTKDQSYFLYSTTLEQLKFLRFPLGNFTKDHTRKLASELGLKVSSKPDSQDICFVPNGDYVSVIEKFRPGSLDNGNIVDIETGNIIGTHKGIIGFTIGQRRGIGVSSKDPLFVIKIDAPTNTVFVGSEDKLYIDKFYVKNISLITNSNENIINTQLTFRTRSSHSSSAVGVIESITNDTATIKLKEKTRAITPGQACVFYDNTRVIGGGIIFT